MSINDKNILNNDAINIVDTTFGDINGAYPKIKYAALHSPDVNMLGSTRGGVIGRMNPILSNPQALDPKQSLDDRQAVGVPEPYVGGTYPYTKVEETESGHLFVKSDAPGEEYYQIMHRTGTYTEYRPDGSFVTSIKGKGYFATADDNTIIVKGTCKIVVEGDLDVSVGGNYNLNIAGDLNITVAGDARSIVSGGMNEEVHGPKSETYGKELSQVVAADHYQLVAGDQDIGVAGNFKHTTTGTADIASKGNMTVTTQGTQSVSAKGNQNIDTQGTQIVASKGTQDITSQSAQTVSSKGNQEINSQGTQSVASTGNQTISSAGTQKLVSSGNQTVSSEANQNIVAEQTNINGADIKIGSGNVLIDGTVGIKGDVTMNGDLKATPSPPSWPAGSVAGSVSSGSSESVEPPDAPDAPEAPKEKKLPKSQEIIDEHTNWNNTEGVTGSDFSIDKMHEIEEDYGQVPPKMVSTAIKKGIVTSWPEQGSFESAPGQVGSSSGMSWSAEEKLGNEHNNVFNAPGNTPAKIDPDTSTISTDGSFKLSKHFTLAQLTASRAGGKIRAHNGVSPEEIVKNLMYLSTNVLDKIHEHVNGRMYISSGYRSAVVKGSSSRSQHMIGQAADIKFPDMGADQYYHVAQWIRDNLDFDQLIMEYSSNSAWIHVSYNPNGNRKQVFSQFNHKKIGNGILSGKPVGKRVGKKR